MAVSLGSQPVPSKTMHSILLVSSDEEFRGRVQRALRRDERLVRWRLADALPPTTPNSNQWVVVDCRAYDSDAVAAELTRIRARAGEGMRCAVVVAGLAHSDIEVIATIGNRATELILADSDSAADLITAVLNDSTQTTAAAIALSVLLRHLPKAAHEIIRCVLASGLQASSVKEVAATLHHDRSKLGRGLRDSTGWTAKELVDLAKASYVAVLLRGSCLPFPAVVEVARFDERRWLDALLKRVFGITASALRAAPGDPDPSVWLDRRLSEL
jgi:hypothetical protein